MRDDSILPDQLPEKYWKPTHYLTREVKDKIDKAARAVALILDDQWDWGDRNTPRHMDGSLRAPIPDVLEAAGWSRGNNSARKYLHTKEFYDALTREKLKLDGGFQLALAEITEDGKALTHMSARVYEVIMQKLSDKDAALRIPLKDLGKLYTDLTTIDAKMRAGAQPKRQEPGLATSPAQDFLGALAEGTDEVRFREIALKLKKNIGDASDVVEGVASLADD